MQSHTLWMMSNEVIKMGRLENYEDLEMSIILFEEEDVITDSIPFEDVT